MMNKNESAKLSRATFLKRSFQLSALAALDPLTRPVSAYGAAGGNSPGMRPPSPRQGDILSRLADANDDAVTGMLKASRLPGGRAIGYGVAVLSASYCYPESAYYHASPLVSLLERLAAALLRQQNPDGTLNFSNLGSPPDTAFLVTPLAVGTTLLTRDGSAALKGVLADLKRFLIKAGEALRTGGVHTPNHRWVVSAALARMNVLYPNPAYLERIDDWLGEGIYNDVDGHYLERSRNYSHVENSTIITLARLLNREALLGPVRKNLRMTYYYMEPDGSLVVTDSRRQDQYGSVDIVFYYLQYRYMAIRDGDGAFSAIARLIEGMEGFKEKVLSGALCFFLEDRLLQQPLPTATPLPQDFEKLFQTTHLLRIRRDTTTTTFFGGVDWPINIISGRSNSPNFYAFRKGNAHLKYMRLSTAFFNMGYFYADGLEKQDGAYILHKEESVPYYQPLPQHLRRQDGDYRLAPSIDGRFWNCMDYAHRSVSNVKTLDTRITLREHQGINELQFSVTGEPRLSVVIELCFAEEGILSGVSEDSDGNVFLLGGTGTYTSGGDTIRFGPGGGGPVMIHDLAGERYSNHFGSLKTPGMQVYITGLTPFHRTLTFE